MKIVITGASGFIGTEVIQKFLSYRSIDILALTRKLTGALLVSQKVTWMKTDYSIDDLKKRFEGADVVIHLAAVRGTSGSIKDYQINEYLTENILIAMRESGVKKIVFASSIAVYSDVATMPWAETDIMTPKTLYGISKAACEHLCMYYARKSGFQYIILRIAQVLGELETRPGMMNTFISQAISKKQLTVIGKSVAKRQFIYVCDLSKVIEAAALQDFSQSETLNIGMNRAYSNLEIASSINRVFANDSPIVYQKDCDENIEPSFMDVRRAERILMIQPRDLEASLNDIKKGHYESISECH